MRRPSWSRFRRDKTKPYTLDDARTELRQFAAFVAMGIFFGVSALMGGHKVGIIFWSLYLALNLAFLAAAYRRYLRLPR